MTNYQEAFKQAEKEIKNEEIAEIKDIMKSILQKIQDETEKKNRAEDAIRILRKEMEDLRAGKIDAIRERHAVSKHVASISPIPQQFINYTYAYQTNPASLLSVNTQALQSAGAQSWNDATAGVYTITTSQGSKEIYL